MNKRGFAIGMICCKDEDNQTRVRGAAGFVFAASPEEAFGYGILRMRERYPVAQGWTDHECSVYEPDAAMMLNKYLKHSDVGGIDLDIQKSYHSNSLEPVLTNKHGLVGVNYLYIQYRALIEKLQPQEEDENV